MHSLVPLLMKKTAQAQKGEISNEMVFTRETPAAGKHEFLFFVKPEIIISSDTVKTEDILELMLSQIDSFGLQIKNVRVLAASYLEKYNIIAQHYGVINKLASDPLKYLSEAAKNAFELTFGKKTDECTLLGGLQFIERFPEFNPHSFDILWQNIPYKKLAGGTYCGPVSVTGETIYVVNGFHPKQLVHFTEKGRAIIVFTLTGDLSWAEARNSFLGATDPSKAKDGSLRRRLLDRCRDFGLTAVVPSLNGAHLSAGPVEGLVECIRYNSDFSKHDGILTYMDFSFGRTLEENFPGHVPDILSNCDCTFEGKRISVFDLTEEKNADEAIALLKKAVF